MDCAFEVESRKESDKQKFRLETKSSINAARGLHEGVCVDLPMWL